MTSEQLIAAITERSPGALLSSAQPNPSRLFLTLARESMPQVADFLFNTVRARLVTSVGTDKTPLDGTYEVSYIFSLDHENLLVSLKEIVNPADPRVPSLTNLIPGADWHEREVYDLLGIVPEGHPDPRRLVLADDWPPKTFSPCARKCLTTSSRPASAKSSLQCARPRKARRKPPS